MILNTNDTKRIYISEAHIKSLAEDVYINKIDNKGKKAKLTYQKRNSSNRTVNRGNLDALDKINTGKMDTLDADTFEYPLKGGLTSYNITSINGSEVMHYFKKYFNKEKSYVAVTGDKGTENYELEMENNEFNEFLNNFHAKVEVVIKHAIEQFKVKNPKVKFTSVSIYPVPSSTRFNDEMTNMMAKKYNFAGLQVKKIDTNLFHKSLENIQRDNEFIEKNKDYYKSNVLYTGDYNPTHEEMVDDTVNKLKIRSDIKKLIDDYNTALKQLLVMYQNNYAKYGENGPKVLALKYLNLCKMLDRIKYAIRNSEGYKRAQTSSMIKILPRSKPASIERRTNEIWNIIRPILRGTRIPKIDLCYYSPKDFEIKKLDNATRMGLKGYFTPDEKLFQKMREELQGTIFVIFDDNLSGGATLSDIANQAKEMGAQYIVPITFGKMKASWNLGMKNITKPSTNGKFKQY